MSRIQQVVQSLQHDTTIPLKAIEQYVLTGDVKILAKLKPAPQTSWSWEANRLVEALAPCYEWTDEDRRIVDVLSIRKLHGSLSTYLDQAMKSERSEDSIHSTIRSRLASNDIAEQDIIKMTADCHSFTRDDKPNSAGRYILSLKDADLTRALQPGQYGANFQLLGFLIDHAVDRIESQLPNLLQQRSELHNESAIAALLLEKCGSRFERQVHEFFEAMMNTWHRFHVGEALVKFNPERYREEALEAARASLAGDSHTNNHNAPAIWMIQQFGIRVLPEIVKYLADADASKGYRWKEYILDEAVSVLHREAIPAVQATLKNRDYPSLRLDAIEHLIALNDGSQDALIQAELAGCLEEKKPEEVIRTINLIGRWNPKPFNDHLWKLLAHKSKPVRDAAARSLSKLGDEAIAPAKQILEKGKADARLAAVLLLTSINSPKALDVLEKRVDEEGDDNVRDAILLALEEAWAAKGKKLTKKDVEQRIERTKDKLKELPADWINEKKLPALKFVKGGPLDKEAVRYLLYRQSRAKEIRADVEAKALFSLIDRKSSGDFALTILNGYLGSKVDPAERWALTVAGLLGDDRVVAILNQQIRQWVDSNRGKMAEYAVEALALLGSDLALLTVDALAIRYRNKMKNVGKAAVEAFAAAAENLGISTDELGDRVVPWLGFEPAKPRVIDAGGKTFEVRIGLDLKLKYHDLEKNKPAASLPKTAPKEVLTEFKELGASLREVVKAQSMRLEILMVRQRRWPVERWRELFLQHPLLLPMAVRLVWGHYDDAGKLLATFRALEDRSLTRNTDDPFDLPKKGQVGIVHPLELAANDRKAWLTHLADYEIEPPFPQMERSVVLLEPEKVNQKTLGEFSGTAINGMTFKGRAERLGWVRGSVSDGGGIIAYRKSFPAAGVDVFLGIEGMYIGIDMYTEIKLQDGFFVRAGTVKIGSYMYDEPGNEKDERVLRFADVPPIVYSETVGDLRKISGKSAEAQEDE